MENIYLLLVIVLFFLAISDLVVGVANDAVNFLNSAIGSKAAPFKVTMIVASLGVFVGAAFSGGMMEIARSGIFHPGQFYFSEIMLIFLAVMITDVILLDTFNTLGLPTSTTVSIVFELLGAAVAIAWMKISHSDNPLPMSDFINSSKALAIISGILISVLIAFTFGAVIQYFARVLFSFNYKRRMKYFGAIYGGFSVTIIVYFMLIKGVKGATFMSADTVGWITSNSSLILLTSFIGFTVILQALTMLFRINILKIIVMFGTFALAMAFAGNDLVNFIGVPLAGYESFKTFLANPGADPHLLSMASLAGKVKTPTYFLLLAGMVMVITLFTSRKARSVIKTSLDLSRQDEGEERFGSTQLSRSIVRLGVNISNTFDRIIPENLRKTLERQFEPLPQNKKDKDLPSFDMIRASVNLVVASMLIAFGTSLKLPLSTTYVTFMVAMGSSLSDKAWDRESAVYRITGVMSVIGGWFFTALSAFVVSFGIAILFYYGGFIAIGVMIAVAILLVIRTHKIHAKRELHNEENKRELDTINDENILESCIENVTTLLNQTQLDYKKTMNSLASEDITSLKKTSKSVMKMSKKAKERKANVTAVIAKLREDSIESGHFYVQVLDYLREILHSLNFIVSPVYDHVANNHKNFNQAQISEIKNLSQAFGNFITRISTDISESNFSNIDQIITEQQKNLAMIDLFRKNEVKRIKKDGASTRNSLLFMNILQETKNLQLFALNLYKSQRDFVSYKVSQKKG
ncbi:MAG: inorganic phosphate transporter [Bacteroidales bacterium]|nr:inorganic phosphate transporter [Bacteroidales bacterium]